MDGVPELVGIGETGGWIFDERGQDGIVERFRQGRLDTAGRWWEREGVGAAQILQGAAEWQATSAELVENDAEREDIAGSFDVALQLFGCHIGYCTAACKAMVGRIHLD